MGAEVCLKETTFGLGQRTQRKRASGIVDLRTGTTENDERSYQFKNTKIYFVHVYGCTKYEASSWPVQDQDVRERGAR